MSLPSSGTRRLLVINGYSLAIAGQGIGVYTIRLLKGLLRALPAERMRVVIPEPLLADASWLPQEVVQPVPGSPPRRANQLMLDVYWASRIGAYVKAKYPGCIYHSPREYYSWSSPELTVTTVHDCNHWIFPSSRGSFARAWWRRATERFAARRSPLTLTVSQWAKRDLVAIAHIPENKIQVIYNWADADVSRASALARLEVVRPKFKLPQRYFLYVGGFSANKNIDALLRSYARACVNADLPMLVAAGDLNQYRHGFGREFSEALRAYNVPAHKVITPGFVPGEDLPAIIAGADVLVYPSKSEGFGYPPVEAMSLGTPVLVADASSMMEVVRNPASRFSQDDDGDLVAKLKQANVSNAAFRCELPEQFTEAYGIRHYLRTMNKLGLGAEVEKLTV